MPVPHPKSTIVGRRFDPPGPSPSVVAAALTTARKDSTWASSACPWRLLPACSNQPGRRRAGTRPVDESQTRRVVLARPHAVERAPTLAPRFVVPPPVVVVVVVVTVVTVVRRVSLDGPPASPPRDRRFPTGDGSSSASRALLQRGGVALFTSASLPPVVRASFRASPRGGFVLAAAAAGGYRSVPAVVFLDRDPGPDRSAPPPTSAPSSAARARPASASANSNTANPG